MDLVRELKEVRFELNLRGYDCEAVDAFLAKLRSDVATVQKENDAASERIAALESQVQDGGGSSETEGTLRRTLVLAQRLADETEAESKQAAAELIDSATAEAAELRSSAEADAAKMRSEAEADAAKMRADAESDASTMRAEADTAASTMRSEAEAEAASMREAGQGELSSSRSEAEALREESNRDAAKSRAEARQLAAGVLEESERRGAERVVVIEQAAQEAATSMREPIRAEVDELEGVRGRLLTDISELENHLEAQRVRVRTAVDALRVGMSGSIEDLERVADDDELLATQPAPEHSGATGADIDVADDVEIIDAVDEAVGDAPTVDDVEEAAAEAALPITDDELAAEMPVAEVAALDGSALEDSGLEDGAEDTIAEDDTVPDGAIDEVVIEEVVVEETVSDERVHTDEAAAPEPVEAVIEASPTMVADDDGPQTEPIPVIATASEADLDESELVDLSEEPSGMFGTDVGEDVDAIVDDADSDQEVVELGGVAAGVVGVGAAAGAVAATQSGADDADVDQSAPVEDATTDLQDAAPAEPEIVADAGVSFVDRFAEAIDDLPLVRE